MKQCLVIQSDYSIILEKEHPAFEEARDFLLRFAELVKCPERLHTYRISRLSLWNAAAMGLSAVEILEGLGPFLRYPLPSNVGAEISDTMALYGRLRLVREGDRVLLQVLDAGLSDFILGHSKIAPFLVPGSRGLAKGEVAAQALVLGQARGKLKVELVKIGYPVEDLAGYQDGDPFRIELRGQWALRDYQREAVSHFLLDGSPRGGSGVLVLPCGAGKTVIGIGAMAALGCKTLILATGITAVRQWRAELLDKTSLRPEDIGEYSGICKEIRPVTIATYQIMTSRRRQNDSFEHLSLFERETWGLIVYDEVHVLPAPIFSITAQIQSRRRLGLTATLVREDRREDEVFCLIGPKRYDVPWKVLEQKGWIAAVDCIEVRVPLPGAQAASYAEAKKREQFRLAACNPAKGEVVLELLRRHAGEAVLLIGMYLEQLREVTQGLGIPLIEGKTAQGRRDELFAAFKRGEIKVLGLSKVGNYAIDLPDATVLIQISGTFGSRQEEAQRLGRVLRPKEGGRRAKFYTLVTPHSEEDRFAMNRQLFLVEQGYQYQICAAAEALPQSSGAGLPGEELHAI